MKQSDTSRIDWTGKKRLRKDQTNDIEGKVVEVSGDPDKIQWKQYLNRFFL